MTRASHGGRRTRVSPPHRQQPRADSWHQGRCWLRHQTPAHALPPARPGGLRGLRANVETAGQEGEREPGRWLAGRPRASYWPLRPSATFPVTGEAAGCPEQEARRQREHQAAGAPGSGSTRQREHGHTRGGPVSTPVQEGLTHPARPPPGQYRRGIQLPLMGLPWGLWPLGGGR